MLHGARMHLTGAVNKKLDKSVFNRGLILIDADSNLNVAANQRLYAEWYDVARHDQAVSHGLVRYVQTIRIDAVIEREQVRG